MDFSQFIAAVGAVLAVSAITVALLKIVEVVAVCSIDKTLRSFYSLALREIELQENESDIRSFLDGVKEDHNVGSVDQRDVHRT